MPEKLPALPPTPRDDCSEVLHGEPIADPYRWLEGGQQPAVQKWVEQQNGYTRQQLDKLPQRAQFDECLRGLMYRDSHSIPIARGGKLFFERRAALAEKAVLMVREAGGDERVLLDPMSLCSEGTTSLGGWYPSPDGQFVAYAKHKNNADEATLCVRTVETGADRTQDVIEGAKYASASWTPDSQSFYYAWLPTDSDISVADRPGLTELRLHKLGTPPVEDPTVFPATHNPECFLGGSLSEDGRFLQAIVQHGWNSSDHYLLDRHSKEAKARSTFVPLVVGEDAQFSITWCDGYFYILTNYQAPRYRVLRTTAEFPPLAQWEELIAESEHSLESLTIVGGKLAIGSLVDAASRLRVFSCAGVFEREIPLPALGTASALYGKPNDPRGYFSFSSFAQPKQILQVEMTEGATTLPTPWSQPSDSAASELEVSQQWYHSADGTRISIFLVHQKGVQLDGSNRTLLYGYGGFNVSLTPAFSPLATAWVRQGGVYAVANLRGGGEFGEAWHRAGMRENKQNVFDDFAAAARYLVDRGYTQPQHLGIYGGSNGGLLVGASLCQTPQLYGAVVCAVPLLDMLRYHLFGSGKTWVSEYGCADDEQQFQWLRNYSPYQNLDPQVAYPPLLMMAADSDDRVDPLHARKFVAALQWCNQQLAQGRNTKTEQANTLLRLERNAGHGGADKIQERVASCTDICAYFWSRLQAPS